MVSVRKDEQLSEYEMLFRDGAVAVGTDDRAASVAPLCYWLCDTFDPERVLTVGVGCELLHILICEKAQNHVMRASCLHVAERFSANFLEARKFYGSALSQVIVPDPSATRMGIDGQFDLIVLFSTNPLSRASIDQWLAAITADGMLVICSEVDGQMPEGEGIMHWQFGPQKLLLASPKSPDGRITTVAKVGEVMQSGHSSLSNALAASMVDLSLRDKRALEDHFNDQIEDLKRQHAADLIAVAKKLAAIEQENIDLRTQLKSIKAKLEAVQPQDASEESSEVVAVSG